MISLIRHYFSKLHQSINKYELQLLFLLAVLLFRLPSLAEPYWYGDEAIYLTIGQSLRAGLRLYSEIIDHKTPLIYYFAMTPTQFWFRILMLGWQFISTILFFDLAKKIFHSKTKLWSILATLVFIILSNFPPLEGHIPNGELFVIGFVLAAAWLLSQTSYWNDLFRPISTNAKNNKNRQIVTQKDLVLAFGAGILASGGILTKVPALLDGAALGIVFAWLAGLGLVNKQPKKIFSAVLGGTSYVAGLLTPIGLSLVYFWLRGSLNAYIQFGLLYNFHYTSNWNPPVPSQLLPLFSLPGKAALLVIIFLISTWLIWKYKQSRTLLWVSTWLGLALFASLLSNRPYPHYMLQLVPAVSLLLILLLKPLKNGFRLIKVWASLPIWLIIGSFILLDFQPYPLASYYQKYFKLITGQISSESYENSFEGLVAQNRQLAPKIMSQSQPGEKMFIWGTNPMLYAQTKQVPASRFTVAFHIHDLKVYDQTLQEVSSAQPEFIVIMKKEQSWSEFEAFLYENYMLVAQTQDMQLFRRSLVPKLLK